MGGYRLTGYNKVHGCYGLIMWKYFRIFSVGIDGGRRGSGSDISDSYSMYTWKLA